MARARRGEVAYSQLNRLLVVKYGDERSSLIISPQQESDPRTGADAHSQQEPTQEW